MHRDLRLCSGWCLAACLSLAAVGCKDEAASSDVSSQAGRTSTDAGGGIAGTASSQGGSAAGGAMTTNAPNQVGQVYIADRLRASGPQLSITADFEGITGVRKCSTVPIKYGSCEFRPNCLETSAKSVYADAGTLSITSSNPQLQVSMIKSAAGSYTGDIPTNTHFDGAQTAHVSASGAVVPAFETDVTVPLVLLVEAPGVDSLGEIVASQDRDLEITISRGGPGIEIYTQGSSDTGSIICRAASESGKLTIPADALKAIGANTRLPLWTNWSKTITAGQWEITVGSVMGAYTPDHQAVPTIVVL
jgi:hypothetical protein